MLLLVTSKQIKRIEANILVISTSVLLFI